MILKICLNHRDLTSSHKWAPSTMTSHQYISTSYLKMFYGYCSIILWCQTKYVEGVLRLDFSGFYLLDYWGWHTISTITNKTMANLQMTMSRFEIVSCILVFWCLSSQRHFGALTVKFPLNPIVAPKKANLQHTITGLFMLTTFWNPYSEILT